MIERTQYHRQSDDAPFKVTCANCKRSLAVLNKKVVGEKVYYFCPFCGHEVRKP